MTNDHSVDANKKVDPTPPAVTPGKQTGPNICPCHVVGPCSESCSCVRPYMSGGCVRCARYGNGEQRFAKARMIGDCIDAIFALAKHTGRDPAAVARWAAEGGLAKLPEKGEAA